MVFLCMETREIIVASSTARPNSRWVVKQTDAFIDQTARWTDHIVSQWIDYYNTPRSYMECGHLPSIREAPEEVPKLDRDQIVVRPDVGGLVKSFERRAA